MLSQLPDTELTPPLYYVLAWPWAHVFGTDEAALRALSALVGTAVVPIAYLAGRELMTRAAGLVAAALVAFNPLLVWYSQEARPYSLLVLLCALSLLFFLRGWRPRARRDLWLWALVSALALLTHYFAAFLVVPEGLWLAWKWRPRLPALLAGAAVAAVGGALIPLAAHERSKIGTGYIEGLSLRRRAVGVPEDYLTGLVVKFDDTWEQLVEAFVLVVAAIGCWLALKRARPGSLVLGALVLAAAGVPFVLAVAGEDYLNTRNMIAGCLPFLCLIAAGFAAAGRPLAVAGAASLCAVGLATTTIVAANPDYHRTDYRASAEAIGPLRGPRAVVVLAVDGVTTTERYQSRLTPMPATGARVAEVVITAPRSSKLGGRDVGRPDPPPTLPAPFRLVERRYAHTFSLVRYRAPRPVLVRPALLARVSLQIVGAPTVLVQR